MAGSKTRILGAEDVTRSLAMSDCIDAVEAAFARFAAGRMTLPAVAHLPAQDGSFHVKSAAFVDPPHYVAVKVNGNFPDNPRRAGLPTVQGAIVLCDGRDGRLLAIIDSAEVTAMRTAAATAVAARHLAREDAGVVTVIGCGIQGRAQLLALREVLPLTTVHAFDVDGERRQAFVQGLREATGLDIVPVEDFAPATLSSQVIVTCTPSRRAFLRREHVAPGTFIAAVGADDHDKQELDPDLLAHARVVVDVLDQCAQSGDLHHAIEAGSMTRSDVVAELGAIVAGTVRPQFAADDIIVFDSTGSAFEDVAAASIIYERAEAENMGISVELS